MQKKVPVIIRSSNHTTSNQVSIECNSYRGSAIYIANDIIVNVVLTMCDFTLSGISIVSKTDPRGFIDCNGGDESLHSANKRAGLSHGTQWHVASGTQHYLQ